MHACCGYPDKVDNEHYYKAEQQAYFQLADPLDDAEIDEVSIEDAHLHNAEFAEVAAGYFGLPSLACIYRGSSPRGWVFG